MSNINAIPALLSTQQRILLTTDGTVTQLVQLFTGETIHVTKLEQTIIHDSDPRLEVLGSAPVLRRLILLSSETKHYVYAESLLVLERMSVPMQEALLNSDTPIGLMWQRERLETYREVLETSLEHRPELKVHFCDAIDDQFLSRTYRVYNKGMPLGLITEKFPFSYFSNGSV